jgi:hypothetical protein
MKKFTLKSGNKPMFKAMGSSPLHVHDGTTSSTTHDKDGSPKTDDYQKRKEALLDKGFTQEDADWMIKHGGDIGPTPTPEHPKYEKKESPAKHGDHKSKEYFKDSKHFMKHNREAMAKEDWVRGFVEKGKLNQPKPKLAKTLGEEKKKSKKSPAKHTTIAQRLGIGGEHTHVKKAKKRVSDSFKKAVSAGATEAMSEAATMKMMKQDKKRMMKKEMKPAKKKTLPQKLQEKKERQKIFRKSPAKTAGHGGKKGHIHKVKGEGDKDITKRGGFNEEITKGIKEGKTKVYKKPDGTIYTSTGV